MSTQEEAADHTGRESQERTSRAERGRAVMGEVMQSAIPDFVGEPGSLGHLAAENIFGDLWERPELARRERRLITLAVLAVLGQDRLHAPLHIKAALDSGDLTVTEVRELAVQVTYYAGWPLATSFDAAVDQAVGKHDAYDVVNDMAAGSARGFDAQPESTEKSEGTNR